MRSWGEAGLGAGKEPVVSVSKGKGCECESFGRARFSVACQAPLSMGVSRQEYWSGLPCRPPGDLPDPGVEPGSPAVEADSLPSEPPGKPAVFP